jgi:outer membrane protein assembly factor BamD
MRSSVLTLLAAVAAALLLAACGTTGQQSDETAGWSAQRLYGEARDAQDSKDWAKAVKYLEKLEARYPYGRYAQQAQLEIAYVQWKADERAASLAAADRFIKLYPNHVNVDYAYYLKGLVNFAAREGLLLSFADSDMSERDPKSAVEAYNAFKEVVTRFPESKYAPDSAARMRHLVNSLAQHDVHVARYYMRRGAYVAAVNRAQRAVAAYPNAPATEEALFIMIHAYDRLEVSDLRDDAERVMRKNFPQSRYYRGPIKRDVAWWKLWDPDW